MTDMKITSPQSPWWEIVLLLLLTTPLMAQTPNIQDCLGAIPVCQDFYSESQSPSGTGNIPNEILNGQTCTDGEINSIWYVFTANQNGQLGFLITPNDLNDDYDWALFNITNADCSDIGTNPNILVSCNAAGGFGCHGVTGCASNGVGNNTGGGCGGTGPLNALVPMQAGETFVLMVSNWTGSNNGYTLDFSGSTGLGVFDETAPVVDDVSGFPESCGDQTIDVTFNEFLQCNTVNSIDFQLDGPGGPYALGVFSSECAQGSDQSRDYTLTIDPPIQSMGDYTLTIEPATDSELLDLCGNPAEPFTVNFTVDVPLTIFPNIGPDTSLVCAGDELLLDASTAGTGWLWEDGSTTPTITVTQAGIYGVTVTDECGIGEDDVEVFVQIEPPTVDFGADLILCPGELVDLDADNGIAFYEWQDGSTATNFMVNSTGDYAVTVTNGCGVDQDDITIEYVPALGLNLATEYVLCTGDTLTLDLDRPFADYQWSDGSTQALRQFMDDGNFAVTVTTQCEVYEASFATIFLVDPTLELGDNQELCPNDSLVLAPGIPGSDYFWQDGSTNESFVVTVPGTYAVTVSTVCQDLVDSVAIDYLLPITTDLGRDTFLCPEDPFLLDASTEVLSEYLWEDNSKEPKRLIFGPGDYTVTVTSVCEVVVDTILIAECEICNVFVPNIFSPNLDGINDKFIPQGGCPFEEYEFAVFDRWGSQVYSSQTPGDGWDGRIRGSLAPQGTYVWFLEYTVLENGYPRSAVAQGDVVIVR